MSGAWLAAAWLCADSTRGNPWDVGADWEDDLCVGTGSLSSEDDSLRSLLAVSVDVVNLNSSWGDGAGSQTRNGSFTVVIQPVWQRAEHEVVIGCRRHRLGGTAAGRARNSIHISTCEADDIGLARLYWDISVLVGQHERN